MAIRYTIAECEAKIVALEALRYELVGVPVSGGERSAQINLSGKRQEIQDEIAIWEGRLADLYSGGAERPRIEA